jgi:hypothetical protein
MPRNIALFYRRTQRPIFSWRTLRNIPTISKNSFISSKINYFQLVQNSKGPRLLIVDGSNNDIFEGKKI